MGKNNKNRKKKPSAGASDRKQPTPTTYAADPAPGGKGVYVTGLIMLIVAAGASLALVLESFGAMALPGCGEGSGCDRAAASVWGSIPGLGWPLSSVGLAYFIGLGVAFALCRDGVPTPVRWMVRASTVGSVILIAVMFSGGYVCKYCLVVHGGNLAFWFIVEMAPLVDTAAVKKLGVLAGCFVVSLATLLAIDAGVQSRVDRQAAEASEASTADIVPGQGNYAFTGRYHYGAQDAPMHIVMFTDYQCPDCYNIEQQVETIFAERTDVSLSIKHFPFCMDCNPRISRTMHSNACAAARAAEAAGILRGAEGFYEMHFKLFTMKGTFNDAQFNTVLQQMGYDVTEFVSVMMSDEVEQKIKADVEEAYSLGLYFTPMIFINGTQLRGVATPNVLYDSINRIAAQGVQAQPGAVPATAEEKFIEDWRQAPKRPIRPAPRQHRIGPAGEPAVEVLVFSDYLDKNTGELDRIVRDLAARRGDIQYEFRHYPGNQDCNSQLTRRLYEHSCITHQFLEATAILGGEDMYWQLHDWVMNHQAEVNPTTLRAQVAALGLDPEQVATTAVSGDVIAAMRGDVMTGAPYRFRAIPAVFVNARQVPRTWREEECIITDILSAAMGVDVTADP